MSNKNVFGKSAVIFAALFAGGVLSGCTEGDSDSSDITQNTTSSTSSVYSAGSPSTAVSSVQSSSESSSDSQPSAESSVQSSSIEIGTQTAAESSVQSSSIESSSGSQPVVIDPASFISEDEAREAALMAENVREYQVEFTRSELGYDKGTAVYYIEFAANTLLYKYKVNALDGTVKANGVDLIPNAPRTPKSILISEEEAIGVALKQHKYSESDVDNIEVEQYYDGAMAMYRVDLYADGIIWGTSLDAVNGSVSSISQAPLM